MTPFEFGQILGATKQANIPEAVLRSAVAMNPLTHGAVHAAVGAPIGAAMGAYNAPKGQKLRGAGRGALTGAVAGAGAGAAGALTGQAIGGFSGMLDRAIAGGTRNKLINQLPNLASIGGGMAGYQLAKQRPAQVAKAANALAVSPMVGKLVRKPPIKLHAAGQAAGQAAQAGSNALKYLGAGAAGLAAGVAGTKALDGKQQKQPPVKAAFAPPQQPVTPGINGGVNNAPRAGASPGINGGVNNAPRAGASRALNMLSGVGGAYKETFGKKFQEMGKGAPIVAPQPQGPQPGRVY
jgi:hypothetical protein